MPIIDNRLELNQPEVLSFDECPENAEEQRKIAYIESLLIAGDGNIDINTLRELARSNYGLVNDELRRKLWAALAGVDVANLQPAPKLCDLQCHHEYNQVVLDVNRSLKRFPPGIPYEQRIALQDQLTVLILRVISKYPHLHYYQGYHDVAITFLLVLGEEVAFAVMEELSTNHFAECMQEKMDATQYRLSFISPIIKFEYPALFEFLQQSNVGILFALPWYLTWFGHSLNSYKAVVRLYDYFLASPKYAPIYVTAAIVLYRANDILATDCDIGSVHCLLSKLPDDLPFEDLLKKANKLYTKYSITDIEKEVQELIRIEKERNKFEDKMLLKRRTAASRNNFTLTQWLPQLLTPKSFLVTTAVSILVGVCAYFYKSEYISAGVS